MSLLLVPTESVKRVLTSYISEFAIAVCKGVDDLKKSTEAKDLRHKVDFEEMDFVPNPPAI